MRPRPHVSEYVLKTEIFSSHFKEIRVQRQRNSNRFRPFTLIRRLHENAHAMDNTPHHPL